MEDMMKRMKLSEAERKVVKVDGTSSSRESGSLVQAVGKVMAERLVHAEGLGQALGKIWWPNTGGDMQRFGGEPLPLHLSPGIGQAEGAGGWTMDVREGSGSHGGV
jgi:septal ring factor EnvC (AmiA/AmiB activator)